MNLGQVIRRVRGDPDTDIALTLVRRGEPGPRTITLARETIQGRSVTAFLIDPGYLYIRVTQFQTGTAEMMAKDIARLLEADPSAVSGVILDLRDNPGGVLSAAVGVSAAFLPPDAPVVIASGAAKESTMRLSAKRSDYLRHSNDDYLEELPPSVKTLPMVVLVNGDSASAAEIVAGALQDNKRATVLGTQTYGKGSIQIVIPFGDGTGMKLTTAYYYTPGGRRIQGKGVTPDIVVEEKFTAQAPPTDMKSVSIGSQTSAASAEAKSAVCESHSDQQSSAPTSAGNASNPALAAPFSGDCQLERAVHLLQNKSRMIRS
jgi:carboxyl-terminal processing protease